ncbi:HEAT repeat domain-containing protein [Coleofasciculus sp. FACHB-64]|nr:HEAT repeat domain-containing protein [Coleofasciculus sp. FACHB-501]MBD2045707.1 HEAT repeat domain-containing protein [Coleofasciculus sp. FACHB-64]
MIDWKPYLEALCNQYARWRKVYTLTDVVGRQRVEEKSAPLFDFMVETVQPAKEQPGETKQKTERLGVLEGLRKYAADHVLLVGRPGSGKSTALARLLLEEAQASREINSLADSRIPVLVELRYYQTSVLDLIRDFLKQHGLFLNTSEIERLLFEKRFLLLVDGINELPSEAARRDLKAFRQTNAATPMIFTTRDLGVGGDLDIAKKLDMQPLSETQMQQFVRAYLPQQGEQMLRQLGSRLREFGQTPLLLWMLCSLFRAMGKVPPNLGLVFRQFALSYDRKLKQDIPISEESRRWWHRLLEQLAWVMTSGEEKTELQVAIPRQKAEAVLTEFLAGRVAHPEDCALCWLKDLLNHHLIQLGAGDQIEFRHQLIQEYYTAESLLKLLPSLGDDELKREYLNYLNWTEPLALMLELVEDEAQAVRVVKLALEVDLRLGARLAGSVKPQWQEQTVALVSGLEIPEELRVKLLGITRSDNAISPLRKALKKDFNLRWQAIEKLRKINNTEAVSALLQILKNEELLVRFTAAEVLENISDEGAIVLLVKALKTEKNYIRSVATKVLGSIDNEAVIPALLEALTDKDVNIRIIATEALGNTPNKVAIAALSEALKDEDNAVRKAAAKALGSIGNEVAVAPLLKDLKDEDVNVCRIKPNALENTPNKVAIVPLVENLKNEDNAVRKSAAKALGNIDNEAVVVPLLEALKDEDYAVCWAAEEALGNIRNEASVPLLLEALKDEDYAVRKAAAKTLGNIGNEAAVPPLLEALKDEDNAVRKAAAKALGNIGNEAVVPPLLEALTDKDYAVRIVAAETLGNIGNELAVGPLLKAVKDEDDYVSRTAAEALGKISNSNLLPSLSGLLQQPKAGYLLDTISAIQERSGYYNYILTEPNIPPAQPIYISVMYILHLSDLHFGTTENANNWYSTLAADLKLELNCDRLDALILSGDIAHFSTEAEYNAAEKFVSRLSGEFQLRPSQIIIVPGNHDLNWELGDQAYSYENDIPKRNQAVHQRRFDNFRNFYQAIKGQSYPLEYEHQGILYHLPQQKLLFLGLNSAWKLDRFQKIDANINPNAITNALNEIRDKEEFYKDCLKIAVWHHPLNSSGEDRIKDSGFMERLAQAGFRFALHGHIHTAKNDLYRYDHASNSTGRKLDIVSAGTFGARPQELVTAYPWQYNLLQLEGNKLKVNTRRREEPNGTWKPDARWLQDVGQNPLPYYEIELTANP